jgi:hypothetical protein
MLPRIESCTGSDMLDELAWRRAGRCAVVRPRRVRLASKCLEWLMFSAKITTNSKTLAHYPLLPLAVGDHQSPVSRRVPADVVLRCLHR